MDIQALKATCRQVRRDIVTMCTGAGSGHPGGSLSCTEALVALYFDVMKVDPKNPKDPARDRFVLSKGHAAPALYGVLAAKGFFDRKEFEHFRQLHSILQGHPDAKKCPGVDASTGSLGQGISIATGMALGAKHTGNPCHVYTIIGDGESQGRPGVGSVHGSGALSPGQPDGDFRPQRPSNRRQQRPGHEPGGHWREVRGLWLRHYRGQGWQRYAAGAGRAPCARLPRQAPADLAAHPEGQGVSFMEGQVGWHGKAPNAEQCAQALKDLEG